MRDPMGSSAWTIHSTTNWSWKAGMATRVSIKGLGRRTLYSTVSLRKGTQLIKAGRDLFENMATRGPGDV